MIKKKIPKDETYKEFLKRELNADSDEVIESFSKIDYKKRLVDSIKADPRVGRIIVKMMIYSNKHKALGVTMQGFCFVIA